MHANSIINKRGNLKNLSPPRVSIIIPTYNSERVMGLCLAAASNQNYPEEKFEIIVVDNYSSDKTRKIAKAAGSRVYLCSGIPPKVCNQRNFGAEKAKGEYLLFLDHDMEMSRNLLRNFAQKAAETSHKIDAWYIPEKIISHNPLWRKMRNFERIFYNTTSIDAARLIKKERFREGVQYDLNLSSGPADWDLDNQLKEKRCRFGIIDACVYHHEENLSLWKYLTKKIRYVQGGEIYKRKWAKRNPAIYKKIIKRQQYGIYYRLFGVFLEHKKWKKVAENFHLYLVVFFMKMLIGIVYLYRKISYYLE